MKSDTHTSFFNRFTGAPTNNKRIGSVAVPQARDGDSTKSLPSSSLLSLPRRRHNRKAWSNPIDPDHRSLFVDICVPELGMSLRQQPFDPVSQRPLQTTNPELVRSYIYHLKKYYSEHDMMKRMTALHKNHHIMDGTALYHELVKWDNDQGRAMAYAGKQLRIPPKKFQWSPTLRNAAIIRRYWLLRLREATHNHNYTDTFSRWQSKIQKHDPAFRLPFLHDTLPEDQIRSHLNHATRDFRKCQRKATDNRYKTYDELLEGYEKDPSEDSKRKAAIVRKTIQTEICRSIYRNLRNELKPTDFTPLSKILIPRHKLEHPTTPGRNLQDILSSHAPSELLWDTVVDREEMETHLLTFNQEAFRAAAQSPCGKGIIHKALTFSSISEEASKLLEGIIPPEWYGDDESLRMFLLSFTIPPSVLQSPPINTELSEADITRGFQHWKESTSTSPSGRHLGHYRALIQDAELLLCFKRFLNIVLNHGILLPRWSKATNVMIEKDKGDPKIHRLRIVHLFEADFNFLLKVLWGSRLVRRADHMDLLHESQYGSVPKCTTLDPIMMTQLTTDLCRITKTNLARFDNDASACYDRIIVALGMLAARRCGMPCHAIQTHARALELMQYTVKTIYGVSEDSYRGTPFEPLFGTGQGSGASPAVWLTLVVLLLHTLDRVTGGRFCR